MNNADIPKGENTVLATLVDDTVIMSTDAVYENAIDT